MRLLIIGSFDSPLSQAAKIAMEQGAKVAQSPGWQEALNSLRAGGGADLIMIDVRQPVKRFIEQMKSERMATPVVACGIGDDPEAALAAIRAGAKEFVPLPPDAELIAAVLAAVSEDDPALIAEDPAMLDVLRIAEQVAPSDASVLIAGESGTGKEVLSRFIHDKSKRKDKIFVAVNCAAIPDNLLESELFGHEKGAFTGAVARRIGKFEEASGGTLLLDEISEMDVRLQAKLLRALQEREIDRLGGNKPVKVDVRILATSNRDMEAEVAAGRFRQDLYFRLNVMTLTLPPLRQRPKDIAALARFFAKRYAEQNNMAEKALSPAAVQALQNHAWPGNVRELENAMQRAVLLSTEAKIEPQAIMLQGQSALTPPPQAASTPEEEAQNGTGGLVGRTVADVERDLIIDTLNHTLGNRTHAATILGISIRTLRNKLNAYTREGIDVPQPQAERGREDYRQGEAAGV